MQHVNVQSASFRKPKGPQAAQAPALMPAFDDAVCYLDLHLYKAATAIPDASAADQVMLLRLASAYAQAMAVIPARGRQAIDAKLQAANWSLDCGAFELRFTADLATELIASAENDLQTNIR